MTSSSRNRELILARVREALSDVPPGETPDDAPVARGYLPAHASGDLTRLLADRLTDYRAAVHRCTGAELPDLIARLLSTRSSCSIAVPAGLPQHWLTALTGMEVRTDGPDLTPSRLEKVSSVITGCAVAIAETGTIVLDAGGDQGRRVLTLVPDHHICVVRPDQIVASVPQALRRLAPSRPLTWISGPSATSDIELNRVEGVHGPRTLDVILLAPRS